MIADNFFHYGTADPITCERAIEIVDFKFGEGEYSYTGLLTVGKKTYFHIIRRDEYEDYGVSTDGKEIITIQPGKGW